MSLDSTTAMMGKPLDVKGEIVWLSLQLLAVIKLHLSLFSFAPAMPADYLASAS